MIYSGCWLVFNQALGGPRHNQRLKLYLLIPKMHPHASTQGASISYTLKKLFFFSVKSSLQKPPPPPPHLVITF